ncbi:response regulator transcription factor [Nitrospirillum sp. BR 11752]|uniref:response regulator transcription factor n=1 Tax=Nitrospirillum sp. BR 11752 TaxID=3104293 RepID=UPI002E989353|nr:response regulator transcription factor [Nitrospirillum sp. BR 11752]
MDSETFDDQGWTPVTSKAHILLIEDDRETADEIIRDMTDRGYMISHADNGRVGLERAREGRYDLLILDRMLPEVDGLSIIGLLRAEEVRVPVLFLSALNDVDERVRGLKAGGDDYLTKPFVLSELSARVEALLRRPAEPRTTRLRVGPLELDLISREANRDGRPVELLPREFKLLEYLMRHPAQVITRAMLLEDVWNYRFSPQTNLVDVHIGKLRRKVDAPGDFPMIYNIRNVGFVLREPQ